MSDAVTVANIRSRSAVGDRSPRGNVDGAHRLLHSLGTFGVASRLLPVAARAQLLDCRLPEVIERTHRDEETIRQTGDVEPAEHEARSSEPAELLAKQRGVERTLVGR